MKVCVIICGANGERAKFLERAMAQFDRAHPGETVQFSACTVACAPIMIEMSGGNPQHLVAVNGCVHRCSDAISRQAGMEPKRSLNIDQAIDGLAACGPCRKLNFPEPNPQQAAKFADLLAQAVEECA